MRVLINAISIAEGGGLVVLKNLLRSMHAIDPTINWFITIDPRVIDINDLPKNVILLPYRWVKKSPLHHLFWYEICLPKIIKKINADLCFSQTNFLPRRKLSCPTLLLLHHAGYFSSQFTKAYLQQYTSWRTRLSWFLKHRKVYQSIRNATLVTVQTMALAKKISAQNKVPMEKISVIPHGAGLIAEPEQKARQLPKHNTFRIGYITKFGVQKDFITAFSAIALLKKQGISAKLVLTLNPHTLEYPAISDLIKYYDIEENIENNGEVASREKLTALYQSLDLFIFPSWCESFGFTLLEAMAIALPVIAADTDSNQEILKNKSALFITGNSQDLAEKMYYYIKNENAYQLSSQYSLDRAKDFCWHSTASQMITVIKDLITLPNNRPMQ